MKSVLNVLIGVLAGFILAGALFLVTRLPAGQPVTLEPSPTKVPIEVQVSGAVVHPGLYAFPEGSRVQDAVSAAGGLLASANTASVNLAAKLEDGQLLIIASGTAVASGAGLPGTPSGAPFTVLTTPGSPEATGDLVDINTATLDELDSLPGIGPTTAQRIIDYRTLHGPFAQIEDIMNVTGVGVSTFDNIQDLITVGE